MSDVSNSMLGLLGGIGVVSLLACFYHHKSYNIAKTKLKNIKRAKVHSVAEAIAITRKEGNFKGIVEGLVESRDREETVYTEIRHRSFGLFRPDSEIDKTRDVLASSFTIKDQENRNIPVYPSLSTYSFGLDYSRKAAPSTAIISQLLKLFYGEIYMGHNQYSLKEGEAVSLLGKVGINHSNGRVEMSKIKYIYTGSKQDIINYKSLKLNEYFENSLAFGIFTVALLGIAAYIGYKKYQKYLAKKAEEKSVANLNKKLKNLNILNVKENCLCTICYTNVKNVIYTDCGHLALCQFCDLQLEKAVCPVCRTPITKKVIIALN